MKITSLLEEKMKQLSIIFKDLVLHLERISVALNKFSAYLRDFVQFLDAFLTSPSPSNGIRSLQNGNTLTILCKSEKKNIFNAYPPHDRETRDFLGRVITSHLLTHGATVVIGSDPIQINLV